MIKYYIPKPLKVLLIHESLDPLNVFLSLSRLTHSLTAYPRSFQLPTGIVYKKKYTHTIPLSGKTTTTKKTKGVKNQIPALPKAKQMSTKPSWLSPQLSSKCARTHTLSYKHTRALQPQVEREGDASKGSVWTVAATAPPPPRPLYTTMNK